MAIFIDLAAGTPKVGLWCPRCLLPSGYEVPVYGLFESGPIRVGLLRKCNDCGEPLAESG